MGQHRKGRVLMASADVIQGIGARHLDAAGRAAYGAEMNALTQWLAGLGAGLLALSVGTLLLSLMVLPWLLVRLPEDLLITDGPAPPPQWGSPGWWLRNLLGLALVSAGVLMLVLPGQGVLTLLAGLLVMDFPGKRRLMTRLIKRPGVLSTVNRLRRRLKAPPIQAP